MNEEEKKSRVKQLPGKVSSHAVCAECAEDILQVGRTWMHANIEQHNHEARPAAHQQDTPVEVRKSETP